MRIPSSPEKYKIISFCCTNNVIIDLFPQSSQETDATIWFGHYPTSTIISPSSDLQEVMKSGLIYLCGHLHNLHGLAPTMFVRHKVREGVVDLKSPKFNTNFKTILIEVSIFLIYIPRTAEI